MRAFRNSLIYWDEIFFNSIFQLGHRRFLRKLIPVISRSGDGYLYPIVALAFWFVNHRLGAMLFCSSPIGFAGVPYPTDVQTGIFLGICSAATGISIFSVNCIL
jgi:hypothetical protein